MIRIVIYIVMFSSIVKFTQSNNPQNPCHGGVFIVHHPDFPCDCTGLTRTGRFCNDPLRPGLILVPGGRNLNFDLENERRHAKVIAGKMKRILYNRTTDTMIGIFDTLVYSVYFDKATVDKICSIPTDTCNITEDEILDKIHDKIECRLHKDQHTVYGTCSAPNNRNANEEQTFMKRLNKNDTRKYWNLQIWEERCSMLPNTRNYTGKRLIGCTPAVIAFPTPTGLSFSTRVAIGIGFAIGSVVMILGIGIVCFYYRTKDKGRNNRLNREILAMTGREYTDDTSSLQTIRGDETSSGLSSCSGTPGADHIIANSHSTVFWL